MLKSLDTFTQHLLTQRGWASNCVIQHPLQKEQYRTIFGLNQSWADLNLTLVAAARGKTSKGTLDFSHKADTTGLWRDSEVLMQSQCPDGHFPNAGHPVLQLGNLCCLLLQHTHLIPFPATGNFPIKELVLCYAKSLFIHLKYSVKVTEDKNHMLMWNTWFKFLRPYEQMPSQQSRNAQPWIHKANRANSPWVDFQNNDGNIVTWRLLKQPKCH